ncbi:MAG: GTP cyclohydrolase FolE2 [Candidatus Protistobacter heckmanni]|nr:GTP cyclohydrolase FolE2 [Candidatus Protistobacter heckmanni]
MVNTHDALADVQASLDLRQIPIQRVGIRGVRHPLQVRTADGVQPTVGMFDLDVYLPADQKGTHMSRFVALLDDRKEALDPAAFRAMLADMLGRLEAPSGRIEVNFPYFVSKAAPVSGVRSLMDYQVSFIGEAVAAKDGGKPQLKVWLKVLVPVTSLCPCSKEISQYGAHNQRSHITIKAELDGDMGVEEIIRIAEEEASCELWGLLKRTDEKYVTERAYENPKFVEDLVRDVATRLDAEARIRAYVLEAENFESIHNHSAYALIERSK